MSAIPRPPRWLRRFLPEAELQRLARAVAEAEALTAGEIRIHLDADCPGEVLPRATAVFEGLGMHRTAGRTGVLVYLAILDHKVAVIGDAGIHERVPPDYWERVVASLTARLREGRPAAGLAETVRALGDTLAHHFPREATDRNEVLDEVSFEDEATDDRG